MTTISRMTVAFAALALLLGGGCRTGDTRQPKALVIMLDGARADALDFASTPHIDRLKNGDWQPAYRGAFSDCAHTVYDAKPNSATNHVAIATGVSATKHRVFNNGEIKNGDFKTWPGFLRRLKEAQPEKEVLFCYQWHESGRIDPNPLVPTLRAASDAENGAKLAELFAREEVPDATLYYIDAPDLGGHAENFYPFSPLYLYNLHFSDTMIGGLLEAIAARKAFAEEDWLIIVTSDHGGYHGSHGMWGGHATTLPFIIAGTAVELGRLYGRPANYDAAPTVLDHFGIDPAGMNLDGKPQGKKRSLTIEKPLAEDLLLYLDFNQKAITSLASRPVTVSIKGESKAGGSKGCFGPALELQSGDPLLLSELETPKNGDEFTVSAWINLAALPDGETLLFGNREPEVPGIAATVSNTKDRAGIRLHYRESEKAGVLSSLGNFDVPLKDWLFLAVSRNADGILYFCCGGSDGKFYYLAESAPQMPVITDLPWQLGGGLAFRLDDFAIWNRSLGIAELRRIYAAGRQGLGLNTLLGD